MADDEHLVEVDAARWLTSGNSTLAKPGETFARRWQLTLWNCPTVGPYNLRRHRARRPT